MPTLDCSGTEIELNQECILGRHRSSGLQVKDEAASRQHAKIYVADGLWWVEDLGSANGTTLNGAKITSRKRLRNHDKIGIGQTNIIFSDVADGASGAVAASPKSDAVPHADIAKLIGTQIAGYRIDRYLGRGMLGAVYHAHQLNLDRAVAFKVFDPERCVRDVRLAKRFLAEAGKVGSVSDDGLVQLHESGEADGLLWCSMEWIEGDTLEKLMQRDGAVAPELALLIVDKVAAALSIAHSHGVIHGDLRPSHIIVMADGRVKLTDVGMMGIFEEGELPSDGPASVAWYLSPEEATDGASDPRSDVYSLGCLLFHLLTGKPPFTGPDTGAVIAAHATQPIPSLAKIRLPGALDVSKLDALVHGMLAKNPEWRHATMAEVRQELQPIRDSVSGTSSMPDAKPVMRRSSEVRPESERPQPVVREASKLRLGLTLIFAFVVLAALVALILPHVEHDDLKPDAPAAMPVQAIVEVRPTTHTRPAVAPVAPAVSQARPVGPVSPSSPLAEPWAQVQAAVDHAQSKGEWSAAEQALASFAPQAKADSVVAHALNQRQQQLAADGDVWYQESLAKLPSGATAVELANRLRGIDGLRDQALSDNRPDAESRYQEALTKLGQRLNAAKRQARQALESGRVLDLPKIASELAPAFAQTPVTDLHRQFSLLCNEAAGTKPMWVTSWAVTKPKLLAAKGADALAAAAALVLAGDIAEAKALMANDPLLSSGDLLRRREAIFGRKAAVLTFDDPDDLQYIDVLTGNPRMSGGTLTGPPGEVIALACAAPIGVSGWDVAVSVNLEQALVDGQAVVSLIHGETADAQIRIEQDALFTRVRLASGWQEIRTPRPESKLLRLRLAERGGTVTILLNDQVIIQVVQAKIAPGSVLRFEASGMLWSLTDLQAVGGE